MKTHQLQPQQDWSASDRRQLDIEHFARYRRQGGVYRQICDMLFDKKDLPLDHEWRLWLVGSVVDHRPNPTGITFRSVNRALAQLPPNTTTVVTEFGGRSTNLKFQHRGVCTPELFALALTEVVEQREGVWGGVDWLLTDANREAVCRICLMSPRGFWRMLELTIACYPQHFRAGTTAGSYGQFVRLVKPARLEDFQTKKVGSLNNKVAA